MSLANQHIAIIGSGFAGIGLAIRLKLAGRDDFTIFERASSLGGVWRDNTYPGVACDVPAHLYSYSFEPNPNWSRFFSPQSEILAYLQRCAAKYDVMRHIRFESEVASAVFDCRFQSFPPSQVPAILREFSFIPLGGIISGHCAANALQ
jgi:cation diffusion facilitator CzcD-associated flavoprotein CzcO